MPWKRYYYILGNLSLALTTFITHAPALIISLGLLTGAGLVFTGQPALLLPLLILAILPLIGPKLYFDFHCYRSIIATILITIGFFIFCKLYYILPPPDQKDLEGTAYLTIEDVSLSHNRFGTSLAYRGTINNFTPYKSGKVYRNIPFRMYANKKKDFVSPSYKYCIEGKLSCADNASTYTFKPYLQSTPKPYRRHWSLASYRLKAKKWVNSYISRNIKEPRAAALLAGLATGEFHDRSTLFDFGRLGLQHLMAISGFHFAIIAFFISVFLQSFLPVKNSIYVLLTLLTAYYLFIGGSPSIQRAWISVVVVLIGKLTCQRTVSINTLGVALGTIILLNPMMILNLGFQFSFLATAAILLLYSPVNKALEKWLTPQPLGRVIELSHLQQYKYILAMLFRQGLALIIAVHSATIPIVLLYFHKFPLLSLVSNLCVPFLISMVMILFMLALICGALFPPLGIFLNRIIGIFCHYLLEGLSNIPNNFNFYIRSNSLNAPLLIIFLSMIFLGGIYAYDHFKFRRLFEYI
ncbi:MAG: ComEC/Rec2 family competence protein [Chlamydiota bacterium]